MKVESVKTSTTMNPFIVIIKLHIVNGDVNIWHLEAVSEVDVHHSSRGALKHQIRGVAVAETENVPSHTHGGEGTSKSCAATEPNLRTTAAAKEERKVSRQTPKPKL
jgi:hypothetical protein